MASHTGSGKTLAFLLPLVGGRRRRQLKPVQSYVPQLCLLPPLTEAAPPGPTSQQVQTIRAREADTAERARPKRPRAIILEPTRELALQASAPSSSRCESTFNRRRFTSLFWALPDRPRRCSLLRRASATTPASAPSASAVATSAPAPPSLAPRRQRKCLFFPISAQATCTPLANASRALRLSRAPQDLRAARGSRAVEGRRHRHRPAHPAGASTSPSRHASATRWPAPRPADPAAARPLTALGGAEHVPRRRRHAGARRPAQRPPACLSRPRPHTRFLFCIGSRGAGR